MALRHLRSPDEYERILNSNLEEVERLIHLTEMLLELDKIESQQQTTFAPCVLETIFDMLAIKLNPLCADKDLYLIFENRTKLTSLPIESNALIQILYNLITNAIQVSSAGQTINIFVAQNNQQGMIHVVDQGPGIALDEQKHVFERFYQVDASRSGNKKHFGIGLAICKTLIDKYNGKIGLVPRSSEGCDFCISLPLNHLALNI